MFFTGLLLLRVVRLVMWIHIAVGWQTKTKILPT